MTPCTPTDPVRLVLVVLAIGLVVGQEQCTPPAAEYEAMQRRGKVAMGVDQDTAVHRFDTLLDGGRIQLQTAVTDTAGVRTIRQHLRSIVTAFSSGDFSTPAFVHMTHVPGAQVMAERRGVIRYSYFELPRGGEVRIITMDRTALRAVHQFIAFQRAEHHADAVATHASPDE